MSLIRKNKQRTERRKLRTRKHLSDNLSLPRISVFRSAKHFYGQLIDDKSGVTLASCSTLELDKLKGDKKEQAKAIGKELAKRSLEKGVKAAKFDRGNFIYHGRVKNFAEGLREGGLNI